MVSGDRELSDFLKTRPNDEELGESLDFFKQYLMGKGELTEEKARIFRVVISSIFRIYLVLICQLRQYQI